MSEEELKDPKRPSNSPTLVRVSKDGDTVICGMLFVDSIQCKIFSFSTAYDPKNYFLVCTITLNMSY